MKRPTHALNWKTNSPVWVDQWPLSKEKLNALVEEQLVKGNIELTNSPWISLVFVIKKPGKDKWRLVHDLRKIGDVIEAMGPLQPRTPSPSVLPQNWKIAVIDIKDCFFQIPLHPGDAPRFAFSVPSINREAPVWHYHWEVLPQGMKNGPTICQWYIAHILSPIRKLANRAITLHYKVDVLLRAPNDQCLDRTLEMVTKALENHNCVLQPEKIQKMSPWKHLGLKITEQTISPQQLKINNDPKTLQELHQLFGLINWVRPLLGVTTEDLAPLFNLLKGRDELTSLWTLTKEARTSIKKVQDALSSRQAHRYILDLPFYFTILGKMPHFYGLLLQWDEVQRDPLVILE